MRGLATLVDPCALCSLLAIAVMYTPAAYPYYLEDIETPIGRAINLFLLGLILLSSAIFVAQTYPIPDSARNIIDAFN